VTLIFWAIGMFVLGASYGSVFGDLDSFFEGNELLFRSLVTEGNYSFTEQFLPMLMVIMSILASIPTIMSLLKVYGEKKKGRIELIIGGAVSRIKLLGSYLFNSILTGFMMISFSAIGLWIAAYFVMDNSFSFCTLFFFDIIYYLFFFVIFYFFILFIIFF